MRFTILILVVVVSSLMASYTGFPEDPPGADVIDRAFFRGVVDGEEYVVYLVMYDKDNRGTLDVVSGNSLFRELSLGDRVFMEASRHPFRACPFRSPKCDRRAGVRILIDHHMAGQTQLSRDIQFPAVGGHPLSRT